MDQSNVNTPTLPSLLMAHRDCAAQHRHATIGSTRWTGSTVRVPVGPDRSNGALSKAPPPPSRETVMSRYSLADFSFDLRRAAPPADLWVGSGTGTVTPLPGTVCGVGGWFAPPYAAPDGRLTVELSIDGWTVVDTGQRGSGDRGLLYSGGTWRPDAIVRYGTYHQYRDGQTLSVAVRSTLTPRHDVPGFALTVSVRNRTGRRLAVRLRPQLDATTAHRIPLSDWGWMPPPAGDGPIPSGPAVDVVHNGLSADLDPDTSREFVIQVGPAGVLILDEDAAVATSRSWAERLSSALARIPTMDTDIPGLAEYYLRSLASGLVCLWDHPDFVTHPFVATSGMDGGALCAYVWDTGGYAPNLLGLMLGDTATDLIAAMVRADLTDHYAIAPDGTGLGVPYAYSAWSLVMLGYAVAAQHGLDADLVTRLHGTHAALDGRFRADADGGVLRDYGDQTNLLEMRAAGWEHVVASPNAERAWSMEMLAELAEACGSDLPVDQLRATAARIRAEVVRQLWDPEARWFRSRYPDGHTELAYSIQAFDALRAGACPPPVAAALLGQLRPGTFLGRYGVSSVSAIDERHYELGDVDWSGGGAYTGEAPQLAQTLWEQGEPALAWDVLRRVLWMGEHFPYFPQEHYCDRPAASPAGRRANVVAGLTGAEAIVVGLAGVRPRPDGSLVVAAAPMPAGTVELRGLVFRDREVDIVVGPDRCLVTVDGRPVPPGPDGRVLAVPPTGYSTAGGQSVGQIRGSA